LIWRNQQRNKTDDHVAFSASVWWEEQPFDSTNDLVAEICMFASIGHHTAYGAFGSSLEGWDL
jgi:hypothetical protein